MLEYQLGLFLYSCILALTGDKVEIHNSFINEAYEILDDWEEKYEDVLKEHLGLED